MPCGGLARACRGEESFNSADVTFAEDRGPVLPEATAATLIAHSHWAMKTEFVVYLDATDDMRADACCRAAFDEIDRIEHTFSRFRPDSEITRLNRWASEGPVVTDPEVIEMLATAMDVSEKTGGAFDITVGKLAQAWGFSTGQPSIPDLGTLAEAVQCTGWKHVELDKEWRTVHFLRRGIELDLGAIAKGYAVDRAIDVLRSVGVSAIVNAGSSSIAATDIAVTRGHNVVIVNPADSNDVLCQVELGNRCLSTSGVKEQQFTQGGRTYSHLIDPNNPLGEEISAESERSAQLLQATVLAPTSILADSFSTAMFILGASKGKAVLSRFDDCCGLWIYQNANGISWLTHNWPGNASYQNQ